MKQLAISLALLFSFPYGQIDTLEYLSYFPLHVGNRWQYKVTNDYTGFDTTYYTTVEVLNDTLMPNGKVYYHLSGFSEPDPFFRIDTSSLQVLHYYPYSWDWLDTTCVDSEMVIFEIRPVTEGRYDYYTNCGGDTVYMQTGSFQIDLLSDSVGYISYSWFDGIEHNYIVIEGIGVYWWRTWELFGAAGHLVAAEINGVRYGEFVSVQKNPTFPERFVLYQNYPNPFNPITVIEFSIAKSGLVTLIVYDVLGREVKMLLNQQMDVGNYKFRWNARRLPTGIYFITMVSGEFRQTQKVLLLK